jgi:MoaA/NifB/PqqE/SkfB family radical SAM enzyme
MKFIPVLRERLYITVSTHCNLRCRFCAACKSSIPKQVMSNDLFYEVVQKACDFGFTAFNVTPMIGEAFTDPHFMEKLGFLERHPQVENFSFCTNLTLIKPDFFQVIREHKKLQWLAISLYGYDRESFYRLAQTSPAVYDRMVENLSRLAQWDEADLARVELRMRLERSFGFEKCSPELSQVLDALQSKHTRIRVVTDRYSNWGGMITAGDLAGLDIQLKANVVKSAPCAFLFYKPTVLPDGKVNACSAEDGNASMIIGDLRTQDFNEIYSLGNERYLQLVNQQLQGQFSEVCRACCGYHSISEYDYTYQYHQRPLIGLDQFHTQLSGAPPERA